MSLLCCQNLSSISQFPSVSKTKPSIASVKEIKCKQRKKPRKNYSEIDYVTKNAISRSLLQESSNTE